jgi:hypothetical protein
MPIRDHAAAGGRKRAESLSPSRRREIARRAAQRRWMKKRQDQTVAHLRQPVDDAPVSPQPPTAPQAQARYDGTAQAQQPEPATAPAQSSYAQPDGRSEIEKRANLGIHWNFEDAYLRWLDRQSRKGWISAV